MKNQKKNLSANICISGIPSKDRPVNSADGFNDFGLAVYEFIRSSSGAQDLVFTNASSMQDNQQIAAALFEYQYTSCQPGDKSIKVQCKSKQK